LGVEDLAAVLLVGNRFVEEIRVLRTFREYSARLRKHHTRDREADSVAQQANDAPVVWPRA